MTRFSVHWLTSWSGRGRKSARPVQVQGHAFSSSEKGRNQQPPRRSKRASCKQHNPGRWSGGGPGKETSLTPGCANTAEEARKIILIELMVPWEDGCAEAHEWKVTKYQDHVEQCRAKGWQTWLFPVEVGCRGFPAQSVWKTLTASGITGRERKAAVHRLGEAAERASCWL